MERDVIEIVADDIGIYVRFQGTMHLVHRIDCDSLLGELSLRHVLIVGIEGFIFLDERIVPDMDLIADFSSLPRNDWDTACDLAARSAASYFATIPKDRDVWFEFNLMLQNEA